RYLTSFTGEDSYVLITPTTVQLLTDSRFTIQGQREVLGTEVIQNDPRTRGNIANQVKALPIHRLGFEANHLVYGRVAELREDLPAVELVPTSDLIEGQRAHKDAAELAILRRAVA